MKFFLRLLCLLAFPLILPAQQLAPTTTPLSDVPAIILPTQDNKALYQNEMNRRGPGIAPRFATTIEVQITPATHGMWEVLEDQTAVWRLRIQSAGAKSLNLGFTQFWMPEGGKLLLYNPQDNKVRGPYTPADNELHEQLWTPIVIGDELVIEVQVPESRMPDLQLELKYVNHDFLGFGEALMSGSCNLDVLCTETDGWGIVDNYRDIIQSVAVISQNGNTFCTGFLINNANQDCTPYFMTAFHCNVNSSNAPSLVAYWNYQNSFCRQPGTPQSGQAGDGVLDANNTGAIYRAGYNPTDFVLVEFDDPIVEEADGFFAGWTLDAQPPTDTVICVHHPSTDEKRISFEVDETYLGSWGSGSTPDPFGNHVIVPDWDIGTTEPGSSGSPLFDREKRVIGQLHGGTASCNSQTYDSYGWFKASWTGGGTPQTRLSDWLDPDGLGIQQLDGRYVAQCGFSVNTNTIAVDICTPEEASYTLEVSEAFNGPVTLSVDGLPSPATANFSVNPVSPGLTSVLTVTNTGGVASGSYTLTVEATDGTETATLELTLNVAASTPSAIGLMVPADMATDVEVQPTFSWMAAPGTDNYELEVALDPSFTNLVLNETDLTGTSYDELLLPGDATFYWRVRGVNGCGEGAWSATFSFTTAMIDCAVLPAPDVPVTIPGNGTPTITSSIEVLESGSLSDLNVTDVEITHTWIGDLTITLTSPAGTTVVLVDQICDLEENMSLSFDDDTGTGAIPCPPTDGGTYQPEEALSSFDGENPFGTWVLTITDNVDYDGGSLDNWNLDFCLSGSAPSISAFPAALTVCPDQAGSYSMTVNQAFTGPVTLTASGLPVGAQVSFSPNPAAPGDNVTIVVSDLENAQGGYNLMFTGTDGTNTATASVMLTVPAAASAATLVTPANGATNVAVMPTLFWNGDGAAAEFEVELALDANFNNLVVSAGTTNSSQTVPFELDGNTQYFWRVITIDDCDQEIESTTFSFTTEPGANTLQPGTQQFSIFPNPTEGAVQVRFNKPLDEQVQLQLFSINGQQLLMHELEKGTLAYTLDLQNLVDGIYLLRVQSAGQVLTERIVVQ